MDAGRQPVTFENPLYATAPGVSGDPAVIHATQVHKHLDCVILTSQNYK